MYVARDENMRVCVGNRLDFELTKIPHTSAFRSTNGVCFEYGIEKIPRDKIDQLRVALTHLASAVTKKT